MTNPCPNHRVVMVSSETVYASQYSTIATVSQEIYTFLCRCCGTKKELVINHKTQITNGTLSKA